MANNEPAHDAGISHSTSPLFYTVTAAFALMVPAILALLVFPTPMGDLRESAAWGRFLPLTNPTNPSMAVWVAGLTARLAEPIAFWAILLGQILMGIGIVYLYATLRFCIDRRCALLFSWLIATCIYFIAAPLSYAINADMLQIPIWAGVLFHFFRAEQTDRLLHWFALAVLTAAAVLTKGSAGLLILAMVVASLAVPKYRSMWGKPRFYAAAILGALLVTPYLLELRNHSAALLHAASVFHPTDGPFNRFLSFANLVGGTLLFLFPASAIIPIAVYRHKMKLLFGKRMGNDPLRFLTWVLLTACFSLVVLILGLGLDYEPRYSAPLFVLLVLAAVPRIALVQENWPTTERRILATAISIPAIVLLGAPILYGFIVSHDRLQEPLEDAARIIRADWNRRYSCGPGYYLGGSLSANGLSLTGDRRAVGLATWHIPNVSWFNRELLRCQGAVVVDREPIRRDVQEYFLPGARMTEQRSFALPLLRNRLGKKLTYYYAFIAPDSCPP